jgi:transposase
MLCQPYYTDGIGRPSIPPGRYFRMLSVGQFEGLESEREIAWRCANSLSLHRFLRLQDGETVPDHSTLSMTRSRLPPACCTEEEEAKEAPFPLLIRRRGRSSGGRAFG